MDFFGVFCLAVLVFMVIFANILFRRKLSIKKIKDKKIKIYYLIISIISLPIALVIVYNFQLAIEDFFNIKLLNINDIRIIIRMYILTSIVIIYAFLHFFIDKLFLKKIIKKSKIEEYNEIGKLIDY
ncbi:hypothetical protein G6N05_01475 [Flavobacterium sp. F372]|uniref:Uncharacterized protein n=1 Tax=Flavobacterium bernardetii TaxID=2813823 RepID=A0ABR7IUT6_9FLAO|nr:hypothetical protein [Flavobacterium bernardetii]MBC5833544.1 hypothetical protein [Flavobacterium bernardetii]NHF68776.1 hypothetical protein [Flavobacterium bernardetii]